MFDRIRIISVNLAIMPQKKNKKNKNKHPHPHDHERHDHNHSHDHDQEHEHHHNHDHENSIMPRDESNLEPFLGLTLPDCELLLALYGELDPGFAPVVPTVFPLAAAQVADANEKRNSIAKKVKYSISIDS